MEARVIKLKAKKWMVARDYGQRGGVGRQGIWIEDAEGGYCVGSSVKSALRSCGRPVVYRTKLAAERAANEAVESSLW